MSLSRDRPGVEEGFVSPLDALPLGERRVSARSCVDPLTFPQKPANTRGTRGQAEG